MNSSLWEVNEYEDLIDSRQVINRLEELSDLLDTDEICECGAEHFTSDDAEEMAALAELANAGARSSDDWSHGATLVRDSYFQEYAKDYVNETTSVDKDNWLYNHIDWDSVAADIQQDYTYMNFQGVTYWVR